MEGSISLDVVRKTSILFAGYERQARHFEFFIQLIAYLAKKFVDRGKGIARMRASLLRKHLFGTVIFRRFSQ